MILASRIVRAAALLSTLAACAQAPSDFGTTAALACTADANCSSGDLCIEGSCQGQALRHSDALLVSPASASREVPAGVKPRKGWFTLYNLTNNNHSFAVACDSGAVPSPASGTLPWSSKVQVLLDLQAPAAGTSTVTCKVTSGSSKTYYGAFALTLKASGGGGPTPDFAVSASPVAIILDPAKSGATTISVKPTGAFASDVTLTVSGAPAGATATFDTGIIAGGAGTATLTVNAGTAAAGSSTLTITAQSGALSHSASVALTVNAAPPPPPAGDFSVTIAPAALSLELGKTGTAAVTVAPSNGFTGNVSLALSGVPPGATATLDKGTIATGGTYGLNLDAGTAAAGTYKIGVTGTSGALTHLATLSLTLVQTTPPPPAGDFTVAVAPASLSFDQGQTGSAKVTVAATNGFTGDVALTVAGLPSGASATFDNATVSGGSGATGLTITSGSAAAGSYKLTVAAASGALSHSAALSLTLAVPPPTPDFSLTATPASLSLTAGGAAGQSTVAVAPIGAFSREVSLTASGLPSGATASFSQATVTGGSGSSALSITPGSAAAGSYTVTVTGSGGSASHTTTVHLAIAAAPTFSLSVSPASLNVTAGGSATSAISVAGTSGFTSAVTLAASGLPAGVTASFSPASVTGSGSSTLKLATTSSASGSATITVTATGGGLSHTATIALTINAAQCTPDTWTNWAAGFFKTNCAGCHSWATSYASVKSRQANNTSYITDGSMPQGGTLSSADKQRVLSWLGCGSPQ